VEPNAHARESDPYLRRAIAGRGCEAVAAVHDLEANHGVAGGKR
jgi:hypothetical protein